LTLEGRQIVITRAAHQSNKIARIIRERGGQPLLYPCIDFVAPTELSSLDTALNKAASGSFDWLLVTSENTASFLGLRSRELAISLHDAKVAAIGPRSAHAVEKHMGVRAEIVARKHQAEGLVDVLGNVTGLRILLPQSNLARPFLGKNLAARGAVVETVVAYRTIVGTGGDDVGRLLAEQAIDAITFTSPSTVNNFMQRIASEASEEADFSAVVLAAIGESTARALERVGLEAAVQPETATSESLIEALDFYFQTHRWPVQTMGTTT